MMHEWYPQYLDKVNQSIEDYFKDRYRKGISSTEDQFQEALYYAVMSGGKRIRPILAMVLYEEMFGLPADELLPRIIGLEFLHAYSLVHDDLPFMDNDELRRGQLSVWKKYGNTMAILVGDALQAMGIEALSHAKDINIILEITKAIGDMGMARGCLRDLTVNQSSNNTQRDIIRIIDEKTGRLLSSSIIIGAILGGVTEEAEIDSLRWFGVLLGRAFQIRNDILDYRHIESDEQFSTGKGKAPGKSIVTLMGIEQSETLLGELEVALLKISSCFKTSKLTDIVEYVVGRENLKNPTF